MPACCGSAWRWPWPPPSFWRSFRGCRRPTRSSGFGLSSGSVRITSGTNRRLRLFAVTQIAASFVLLAGAGMLLTTLFALQSGARPASTRATCWRCNVPVMSFGRTPEQIARLLQGSRCAAYRNCPASSASPSGPSCRGATRARFGPGFQFSAEGYVRADGEEDPRARFRTVSPGFFAALGVPIIAGRDFSEADRRGGEPVVIVSQSLAQRMFPTQEAVNRHLTWTDPVMKFIDVSTGPRRIVGVAADVDDENVVPGPALSVYHPFEQEIGGGRLFVHTQARSVRARHPDHADHPRAVGRAAG